MAAPVAVPAAAAKPAGGIPKMWIGVGIAAVAGLGLSTWLMSRSSEPTEDSARDWDGLGSAKGKKPQPHADAPEPGSDDEPKVRPEVGGDLLAKPGGGKGSKPTAPKPSEQPAPKKPTVRKPQDAMPQDAKPPWSEGPAAAAEPAPK